MSDIKDFDLNELLSELSSREFSPEKINQLKNLSKDLEQRSIQVALYMESFCKSMIRQFPYEDDKTKIDTWFDECVVVGMNPKMKIIFQEIAKRIDKDE